MKQLNVKVKRLYDDAKLPTYAHATDAGMDLYAHSMSIDGACNIVYGTGIAVEIPEGYMGLVFPRSSIYKKTLSMCNAVGIIDCGYTGEITCKFSDTMTHTIPTKLKNRIMYFLRGPKFQNNEGMFIRRIVTNDFDGQGGSNIYEVGDRIAQLIIMPYPKVNLVEVEELQSGERGDKGYGSTGR